jgi:hypothetical protein
MTASTEAVLYQKDVECVQSLYTQDLHAADDCIGDAPRNTPRQLSNLNSPTVRNLANLSVVQAFKNILKGSRGFPYDVDGYNSSCQF